MATPDMDVIKEIPGYKVILKAILKSQIQQLVEQLASHTDEESVILTASVSDGTLCHLGSDSGKSFLEDHEDIKSQFLGFCLKRHHRRKQVEKEKINMPMARGPPMLPTHLGPGPGTRPQFNRSPRIPYPRQAMPRHSMSPGGGLSSIRSPAMRHEPYPTSRPIRRASLDSAGEAGGLLNQIPLKLPPGGMPKVDNQVIKVEAIDSPENSNNANDSELTSQLPSSSHCSPSLAAIAADNDDKSNSSSSTIPNEPIDTKLNIEGLGSVSGDQDVNSDSAAAKDSADPTSVSNTSTSGVDIDPDINVKVEAITESEMELEITGVEPGKMPVVGSAPQDNWVPDGQGGMYDPSGAMGNPEDMQAYKYAGLDNQKATSSSDNHAGLHLSSFSLTKRDVPKLLHQGVDLDGSTPYSVYEDAAVNANLFSIYNQSISYPEEKRQSKAAAEEGKWKCELCGKCCRTRWKLDTHMRVHTGEKPFECQICQKKFNAKGNMKTHMMVHYK